jgi:MFS family permease
LSLRTYSELLRPPGARRLLIAALLGRIPVGIFSLAIVLVVRRQTGSFAQAGLATAAFAIGAGLVAPLQGRLVDRLGQPRVLLPSALLNALALGGLVVAANDGAPAWALAALAALGGAAVPPLSACMRSQWATLFAGDAGARESAYSLESILNEIVFIVGPALTTMLVALSSSTGALLTAIALSLVGTVAFATAGLARSWRGAIGPRTAAGALGAAGMRTLVLAIVPTGIAFGALEVTMPAFAAAQGERPALAGLLLSAMALGSVLGGLWYGGRSWSRPIVARFLTLEAIFTAGLLPLLLMPDSMLAMGLLMGVAGLALAPSAAAGFLLIDHIAPPGTATEAYTWAVTANVSGSAIGAALAGVIVQHGDIRWALALAVAGPALGTLVAVSRRRSFRAAAEPAAALPLTQRN